MSVDLSEFQTPVRRGPRCAVARALEGLPDDQSRKLAAALEDRDIFGSKIAEVVTGWGYRMVSQTVQRHRRSLCACTEDVT